MRRALALAVAIAAPVAGADETSLELRPGAARDLVQARCSVCHSLDYIQMNSPFLPRTGWEAEVRKMIKVMGAPVPDNEVATIVDYLAANYSAPAP
jgi:mono/diheme cytochrome c family protein